MKRFLVLVGLMVVILISSSREHAVRGGILKDMWDAVVAPGNEIPTVDETGEPHRTWSLFLVCNPSWLDKRDQSDLAELFHQFQLFGDVIGKTNLTVWFAAVKNGSLLDVDRNVEFCIKYQLLPSESPHIITTTYDPNLGVQVGDLWRLSLAGQSDRQIMRLLTKLADQLVAEGLDQEQLGSEQWWRSWYSVFDRTLLAAGDITSQVKLTIKTAAFSVEIAHDSRTMDEQKP